MAEIDVMKAQLVRRDTSQPWGLRLQGGSNYGQPLTILTIRSGSPADRIGLKPGDEVTEIGDTPTSRLSHENANDLIKQYGLSLILTVERRAQGPVPVQAVMNQNDPRQHDAGLQHYQTYDMTGATPAPRHPPQRPTQNYSFQTVSAKPYEPPPERPMYNPPPAPPQQQPHMQAELRGPSQPQTYQSEYPEDEFRGPTQSGTFKVLQSLMANEEPYAGTAGLPPLRTASMERWKADQARKADPSRVKVFMPQSYNTPLSMYSTQNIMDSFQGQAEAVMTDLERIHPDMMSGTQRAVLEQEHN